ncbi:uncharacterized protein LOC135398570 [Ornithodoros turicata]|uniref:uncharacterized protein LOC135398570 n=1 Tax=Ornithodoros turicata TaxID=34597 RepID=UPI003138E5C0
MTGFRRKLATSDNLLEFCSDADRRLSVLATFIDINNAFGSVSLNVAVERLQSVGIGGKALLFISNLLYGRTSQVRLGHVLGRPRDQPRGLPQGSVISAVIFNIVLSALPEALPRFIPTVRLSIYADDLTLWICGCRLTQMTGRMRKTLTAVNDHLNTLGLTISPQKSSYMIINKKKRTDPATLNINGVSIPRVSNQKSLGLTIDDRLSWRPLVTAIASKTTPCRNVQERLAGTSWGSSPTAMLHLHKALTLSRILYCLPFASPSPSCMATLDRAHTGGLKTALGLPQAAVNRETYKEAGQPCLRLACTERLLLQFDRLRQTPPGREILQRIQGHHQSRFAHHLHTFSSLAQPSPPLPAPQAPWLVSFISCANKIPFLRAKKDLPSHVAKALTLDLLETRYAAHTKVFTDGSVSHQQKSCTAAFHIPELNISWHARIIGYVSSTTAELIALNEALKAIEHFPPKFFVFLTDSRTAINRIHFPGRTDILVWHIRKKLDFLTEQSCIVHLQWIPSHVGISGNEKADQLAAEAHSLPPTVQAPPCPNSTRQAITEYIAFCHRLATNTGDDVCPPCPARGLPRQKATVLHRLRTGSAFTPAFLHRLRRIDSLLCVTCNVCSDTKHLLLECRNFAGQRDTLLKDLQLIGTQVTELCHLTHPTGPVAKQRKTRDALLTFLEATGLLATL